MFGSHPPFVIALIFYSTLARGDIVPIDWNKTIQIGGSPKETERYPPQYVDYSPCSCDLTKASCDSFCCCDNECNTEIRDKLFDCPRQDDSELSEYGQTPCRDQAPWILRNEPFHQFFCLFFVHTPHLGEFYPQESERILMDTDEYSEQLRISLSERAKLEPNRDIHQGFADFLEDTVRIETIGDEYTYDSAIVTHSHPKAGKPDTRGYLSLPTTGLNSEACSWSSPIRFLIQANENCWSRVTRKNCEIAPTLNPHNYLKREKLLREDRDESPKIFSTYPGDTEESPIIQTFYFCKNPLHVEALLAAKLEENNFGLDALFGFENRTITAGEVSEYVACTLDSLKSVPDPPKVQAKSDIETVCTNVVRSVRYTFIWNASQIVGINARIFIEDVDLSLETSEVDLEQSFSVRWRDLRDKDADAMDADPFRLDTFPRSGNPGYDPGRPIISGYSIEDVGGDEPQIEVLKEDQMFIFQPDYTGFCAYSKARPIKFLTNTESVCNIQLTAQNFSSCQALRQGISDGVSIQFQPDRISATGFVYLSIINFIEVVKQDISEIIRGSNQPVIEEGSGEEEAEPTTPNPADSRNSFCQNVPASVILDILYSEAGIYEGKSIYEIVGAYVRYEMSDWLFSKGFGSEVQQFPIHSSVRFTKKPPRAPDPVKSYYLRERRDRCPSLVTCWDDLFYPFRDLRKTIRGSSEYRYSLAMGLSAVIVATVSFAVSKPWW